MRWLLCRPALGLSGTDVRTLILRETGHGICGWDGKEVVVSDGTFVLCHPDLNGPVSVQLCTENLIPRMSTFLSPFHKRGAALLRRQLVVRQSHAADI